MKLLTAAQIREWDQYTIAHEPKSPLQLMERAASACVAWLASKGWEKRHFHIFCGKGNNGGDGLAIARMLSERGINVTVFILELEKTGSPLFQENFQQLNGSNVKVHFITSEALFPIIEPQSIIIDALFGTGLHQPLEGLSETLVHHINRIGAAVVSIDLPSGMFADASSKNQTVVRAQYTLTFQVPKQSFMLAENSERLGKVLLLDICLSADFYHQAVVQFNTVESDQIKTLFRYRDPASHKGHFGHALLIGGSYGKIGAMVLATAACMRSGCGLATAYIPTCGYAVMQTVVPEAMVHTGKGIEQLDSIEIEFDKYAAIGIGPGMGTAEITQAGLLHFLEFSKQKMVLDADALNIISNNKEIISRLPHHTILTPHPKEFDRLFGDQQNEWERIQTAMMQAKALQMIIILKGHRSLIALPDGRGYFNQTGNAGLAKGGSGDVLTGMITAFLAQGYTQEQAALLGVYLHGLAADEAIRSIAEESLLASDVIASISQAFKLIKMS